MWWCTALSQYFVNSRQPALHSKSRLPAASQWDLISKQLDKQKIKSYWQIRIGAGLPFHRLQTALAVTLPYLPSAYRLPGSWTFLFLKSATSFCSHYIIAIWSFLSLMSSHNFICSFLFITSFFMWYIDLLHNLAESYYVGNYSVHPIVVAVWELLL